MNKIRKLALNIGKLIPAAALMLGATSASQACMWWFHQPKVPTELSEMASK